MSSKVVRLRGAMTDAANVTDWGRPARIMQHPGKGENDFARFLFAGYMMRDDGKQVAMAMRMRAG